MDWTILLALSFVGLSAIALSMSKHHRAVTGRLPAVIKSRLLRLAGWVALTLALGFAVQSFGAGYGLVALVAALNVAGIAVALLLTWREGWSGRRVER